MKNPVFRNSRGTVRAISDLWYCNECTIADVEDIVEDSKNGTELVSGLNSLNLLYKFTIDRETDKKVRLKCVDGFCNINYFETTKE